MSAATYWKDLLVDMRFNYFLCLEYAKKQENDDNDDTLQTYSFVMAVVKQLQLGPRRL